jgi:Carboxypeptidase regulatory-like domain/TonB-dependent Receptor Plug Domain
MSTYRGVRVALVALALAAAAVEAQAQVIQGVVIDAVSRAAVAGAEVELLEPRTLQRTWSVTDSAGAFLLTATRAGTYRLRVTHPSYVTYEADSVAVGGGEAVMLEIRLGQAAIPLEPLVVTARRQVAMTGFDERRKAGFGRFITREDIDRRSAFRTSDLLRNVQGITLRPAGRSGSFVLMRGGGTGLCQPAIWVDGILTRQVAGGTIDELLAPNAIEAVEVYTAHGGAPTEYIAGSCGVILFWTRRGSGGEGEPWQWKKMLIGAGVALVVIVLIAR